MNEQENLALIRRIQREKGARPFYLYDLDGFSEHLAQFKIEGVSFWYATKANPLSHILKVAAAANFGIDCASAGEFRQALRAGVAPDRILLTGPAKSKSLLKEALSAGLRTFVLESLQQVQDLEALASAQGVAVRGLLRLQIAWQGTEKSVLGGSKVSPFGLDAESWKKLNLASLQALKIVGIHCFQWGNLLDSHRLEEIWFHTAKEARALALHLKFELEVLDLGGGLGIPYHGEKPLAFSAVKAGLEKLKRTLEKTEIWMELGRYAVGPFGKYVTQVVDRKTVFEKNLLVLEGGVHHLVRPALIGEAFPAEALLLESPSTSTAKKTFDLHGPLCTSLDHLGQFDLPAKIGPGDSIVLHQCGAYGFTESMPYFLCHDLAAEFTWQNKELYCARPWQTPEAWLV